MYAERRLGSEYITRRRAPARIRGAKGKKVSSGIRIDIVFHSYVWDDDCRRQVTARSSCRTVVSVSFALVRVRTVLLVWGTESSTTI
jgi:hypothetical protein